MVDCNLGAEVQLMHSLVQNIFLKKACIKSQFCYIKQHLWCYDYDYKCNHYSLVAPTVVVKQMHVTS